jgi:hypothetical protein
MRLPPSLVFICTKHESSATTSPIESTGSDSIDFGMHIAMDGKRRGGMNKAANHKDLSGFRELG